MGAVVQRLGSEGFGTDESVRALLSLKSNRKVVVVEAKPYSPLGSYLWSPLALWFWAGVGAVLLSLLLTTVTRGVFLYLRYVFGGALILFLPGYALIEALYPKKSVGPQLERVGLVRADMDDDLTRFALSIGLSLALVPLDGLVLNYTPFGIRLLPVAVSLAGLTVSLLSYALYRRHRYYKLSRGVP